MLVCLQLVLSFIAFDLQQFKMIVNSSKVDKGVPSYGVIVNSLSVSIYK